MRFRRAARRFGRAGGLAGSLVLAAAILGAAPARADVVIGVAVPRSGAYVAVGEQVLRGVQAAARDANAKGGLDGQTIVLDVQDDACDSNKAVAVANHYATQGVRLVVGHVCSNASLAASEVYAANGTVMITAASVAAKLTDRGLPTIFRVCGRDDDQAKLSATVLAERFREKKIAILNDLTPGSRNLAAATKENLNRIGINEAIATAFAAGDADDAALADRLKEAGIAVAYYGGDAREMGRLVRISAERGFKPQWFGTSAIATQEFATIAGPASNGVLMTFYLDPRRKPEAAAVVAAFKAEGVEPEGSTIYGYAALQALVAAGNFAHTADSKRIAATLHAERFDLVLGPVGFDGKGDVTAQGYVLYVWNDGAFTYAK
ncbi:MULTISPECIES: branched-chain amino acid ABC transporter substrate-binding protein [unclassified Methylobacterium]|uniref:branched-chain amino acid ABC transporter substrate-binding protein n=1 Tax=unclassified Methylobacterium TaxID=2615210 RepID=UPI0006F805A0|nr:MULTISPECIES: branched-chain amino acid ABC transporter substrate-binding protein [unclassified Methylobacterium]KQO70730.1 ABC transporter [Methylobacterium sp. Leaf89]KQO75141.1 ABC transporter [Methylobacterium sp. Leaf88]KQP75275.1 ABC transporter [Methylobacterium sp. Leaf111]KQU29352.1 ABC transporter [Methylobacterium sp. Leaf94]